jgi:biopolymer transport protein ExbD
MIDMFIVVLIFLLMCFSASAGSKAVSPQIRLPIASKVDALSSAPVVALSNPSSDPAGGVITLEGSEISTSREALEGGADWLIAKLTEQLEVYKHNWKLTHPHEQFPGTVILQADQQVDFKVLKRVIYSCGVAGYANIHFAVRRAAAG